MTDNEFGGTDCMTLYEDREKVYSIVHLGSLDSLQSGGRTKNPTRHFLS